MHRVFHWLFVISMLTILATGLVYAEATTMSHQGRLLDSGGLPANGSYDITYRLFDAATGGTMLWEETQLTEVDSGYFSVVLGETTPLDFTSFDHRPDSLWLEVQIGGDSPISPRTKLTASPLSAVTTSIDGDLKSISGALMAIQPDNDTIFYCGGGGAPMFPSTVIIWVTTPTSSMSAPPGSRARAEIRVDSADATTDIVASLSDNSTREIETSLRASADSARIQAKALDESFGNGVIQEIVSGQAGDPTKGALRCRLVTEGGLDTMTVYLLETTTAGAQITMVDSLGDTTVQIDGKSDDGEADTTVVIRKGRVYFIGPDGAILSSYAAGELMVADSTGDTTLYVDGNGAEDSGTVGTTVIVRKGRVEWRQLGGPFRTSIGAGNLMLADSTGDTTIYLDGKNNDNVDNIMLRVHKLHLNFQKKNDGPLRASYGAYQMLLADSTGDTTVTIDGDGGSYGGGRVHIVRDTVNALGESVKDQSELEGGRLSLANLIDNGGGGFDPNGGIYATATGISFVDSTGDTTLQLRCKKADEVKLVGFGSFSGVGTPDTNFVIDTTGSARFLGQLSAGTLEQLATLTVAGDICATGTIGACSDARYKTDVTPIAGALDKVLEMRGVNYRWKRDEFKNLDFAEGNQIGVIAQEVMKIAPEVVSQNKNGYYSVDYGKLTPLLIEAIKTQQQMIQSQSSELDSMKSELAELKQTVQQLAASKSTAGNSSYAASTEK